MVKKKGDVLLSLIFNFALEYTIRKAQEQKVGLKLSGTQQLLVYDDGKVAGLKVNTEKTKYMLISCHHNTEQNHNMKTDNRSFENVAKIKYLGMTVTNQYLIHEEIKSRLHLGKACYHSVQNLLSSFLLFKNVTVNILKTIILPVVLYRCETLSLTLREKQRLRVSENRVHRRIFGLKRDEVIGAWRKLHSPSTTTMIKPMRMRWAEHVAYIGEKWNECRAFSGKARRKDTMRKM
jgi:hypothetical protein